MQGDPQPDARTHSKAHKHEHPYTQFWLNMALGFIVMYFAMFTMIDGSGDFSHNLNMFYMAATMWASMGILMLATMPGMFPNRKVNLALYLLFLTTMAGSFAATRLQASIDNGQFIASMIPHHSGAILMCRKASLSDPELVALCRSISEGQRREIDQMRSIERRLSAHR